MKNGFIYPAINSLIEFINKISLVELLKYIVRLVIKTEPNSEQGRSSDRIVVDFFIIFKFVLILAFWTLQISVTIATVITWYFILYNLFTYFYRHVWSEDTFNRKDFTIDRMRRRFMNLIIALFYSHLCFAYLYAVPYKAEFQWGEKINVNNLTTNKALSAVWFSISNAVAANYSYVTPHGQVGNAVAMIQLLVTFVFLTIIIARSIPEPIA